LKNIIIPLIWEKILSKSMAAMITICK